MHVLYYSRGIITDTINLRRHVKADFLTHYLTRRRRRSDKQGDTIASQGGYLREFGIMTWELRHYSNVVSLINSTYLFI